MEHKTPILITQVGNGFMVEPKRYDLNYAGAVSDVLVFNKIEDLKTWMNEHFEVPVPSPAVWHSAPCSGCGVVDGHFGGCPFLPEKSLEA